MRKNLMIIHLSKKKHPDSKWFGGEKYFDNFKKQHDKPFKVRTRRMDEDLDF